MKVFVNEDEQVLEEGANVSVLLSGIQVASEKGIAVAVNNMVVPKTNWPDHILQENDQVVIIRASQGG